MIRCGVFVRQSDADEGDELAVSRQWDEILEKIIVPRGWEPVRYCDNDRTALGAKRKLPERDRMLKDVEAGDLQAIAVWDLDRLYREPVDLERIIAIADKYGTLLATVTGDVDLGTDNGRLFARIKGAVAKAEAERKSARQKAKYRQLAEAGQNFSPRRSFGRNDDGSLHPIEAPLLAQAYELVLAGHKPNSILTEWNRAGVTSTLGNEWKSPTQLTFILKNPRNAGLKSLHRQVLSETKLGFEPIVTLDVWRAVNDILADPARRPVDVARKRQLSGLGLCGECAAQEVVSTMKAAKTSSRKAEPIYRCRTCFRVTRLIRVIDDHLDGLVIARLQRPDARELLIDQRHPDLDTKRLEATALRKRLTSLAVMHAEGDVDDEQLREGTKRIKSKLRLINQAIEDANMSRVFKGVTGDDAQRFSSLPLDRRRTIIDALMTVTLLRRSLREPFDPDSIVIDWKRP